jgi:hypothetical protein
LRRLRPPLIFFVTLGFIDAFDWDKHIKDAEGCRRQRCSECQAVKPTSPLATQRISGKDNRRPTLNLAPSHSTTAVMSAATTIAANRSMRMTLPSHANESPPINATPISKRATGEWPFGLTVEYGVESRTPHEYRHVGDKLLRHMTHR